jgi:quercetin dioxygenase-like cupin family protein
LEYSEFWIFDSAILKNRGVTGPNEKEGMMKKLAAIFCVPFFLGLFIMSGTAFAGVYVIENSKGKVPVVIEKDDPAVSEIKELNNLPCEGFRMNTVLQTVAGGLLLHRIELDPNGTISDHASPDAWVVFIVQGNGLLVNTKDGKKVSEVKYKAGDIIIFRPNTMHYWKGGSEKSVMFGVHKIMPK